MKLVHRLPSGEAARWKLDQIATAPFCVHDCFHIHWRWGSWVTERPYCGWKGDIPHAEPGAPMVRDNQDVTLRMTSPSSVVYRGRIADSAAGSWQILNHHGCAYAIDVFPLKSSQEDMDNARLMSDAGEDKPSWASGYPAVKHWATFYLGLRYLRGPDFRPRERLLIRDLDRAREL
jgi:hypothetical protein